MFESISSAYKPRYGNQIAKEARSQRSKSLRGSTASARNSLLASYDVDGKDNMDPELLKKDSVEPTRKEGLLNTISVRKSELTRESAVEEADEEIAPVAKDNKQSVASVRPEVVDDVKEDKENLNLRAAIVHMVGDMVQSTGVIVAALIIYIKPDWTIADPICTFLFSILVMITTVPIFRDCMRHLMETSPDDIDTAELYNAIKSLPFVHKINDFHLWTLSEDKPIFTAQIAVYGDSSHALNVVTELL